MYSFTLTARRTRYWKIQASDGRRTKEGDGLAAVEQAVIVGERDDHDRADDDLAIDDDGAVLDGVHSCVHAAINKTPCFGQGSRQTHRGQLPAAG